MNSSKLQWTGEFVPIEAKGLDKLKKPTKPDTTVVKKDIVKTSRVEKIPASMAENLLKKNLIEKEFALIFKDVDVRTIYVLHDKLVGPRVPDIVFKEAAVRAKLHLEKTYGKYKLEPDVEFNDVVALAPFAKGELTELEKATAVLYMWFLYGENKQIASDAFATVLNLQAGTTDLADFVGYRGLMHTGLMLEETLVMYKDWATDIFYHSFDSVELVLRQVSPRASSEFLNALLRLDFNRFDIADKVKAFLILVHSNSLGSAVRGQTDEELYEMQKSLSKQIFIYMDVDKTRQIYGHYNLPKYWLALVKLLVPIERISSDNLIFLVSELQRRNALNEAEEEELVDASRMLELTRNLDNSTLDQERRGFTFRG